MASRFSRTRTASSRPGWRLGLLLAAAGLAFGCGDDPAPTPAGDSGAVEATKPPPFPAPGETAVDTRTQDELVAAGRATYNANCIACHAMNPAIDGALGPAVAGSSLELLEARVMRGEYPPGYEPKRGSRVMIALPHLAPRVPELAAYLQSL